MTRNAKYDKHCYQCDCCLKYAVGLLQLYKKHAEATQKLQTEELLQRVLHIMQ